MTASLQHPVPQGQRETFFFHEDDENFLFVAQRLFEPASLREMRRKYVCEVTEEDLRDRFGVANNSLRLRNDWFDVWRDARLSTLPAEIRHFDKVLYPPMLRTVATVKAYVPWHQDLAYMSDLGPRAHKRIVTCFVPLNEEPALHPSLRFTLQEGQTLVPHPRLAGKQINSLGAAGAFVPAEDKALSINLELGDAFIFGQRVLHQTWCKTDQFEPRHSVEFRITGAEWLMPGKDYFDLATMNFLPSQGAA